MDNDRKRAIEQTKELSFKEKFSNYWDYYKIHTIVGILLIIFCLFTLNECMNRVNPDLNVLYVSRIPISDEVTEKLEEYFAQYVDDINNDGMKVVSVMPIVLTEDNSEQSMAMYTKLQVELSAGESKLYIVDEDFKDFMTQSEGLVSEVKNIKDSELLKETQMPSGEFYLAKKTIFETDKKKEQKLKEYDNADKIYNAVLAGE